MGSEQSTQGPSHPSPELPTAWRTVNWGQKEELLREIQSFNPSSRVLKILLHGTTGAGKSCFINTVQRILLGRNVMSAAENSTFTGASFTEIKKTYRLKRGRGRHYPFEIIDIRGLEEGSGGIQEDDIVKILKGHILDGYTFNPGQPITEDCHQYKKSPTLSDKIHCLVSVLPADAISRMDDKTRKDDKTSTDKSVFDQMKSVRQNAKMLGIPQVTILTKVDRACPLVQKNLQKIYTSKKIKEKVDMCSVTLGVPLNSIYPIRNYHKEIAQENDVDVLVLTLFRDIIHFANDFVEDQEKTSRTAGAHQRFFDWAARKSR